MDIKLLTKKTDLLDIIENNVEKNLKIKYRLVVVSAYFDNTLSGLKALVDDLLERRIAIKEVVIYGYVVDMEKNIPLGIERIFSNIKINIYAYNSTRLFHSKAIQIVRISEKKPVFSAILSANCSINGYYAKNIEVCNYHNKKNELSACDNVINEISKKSKIFSPKEKLEKNDSIKFDILSSGVFIHKWNSTINQLTKFTIEITNKKSEFGSDREIRKWGIEESKSLTMNVLNFKEIKQVDINSAFFKDYTIESFIGRWCPKILWDTIYSRSAKLLDIDAYIQDFNVLTNNYNLDAGVDLLEERLNYLFANDYIEKSSFEKIQTWKDKIVEIREDFDKYAERFLFGYYSFDMPYDVSNTNGVNELFESIISSAKVSRNKNELSVKYHFKHNPESFYIPEQETIEKCRYYVS